MNLTPYREANNPKGEIMKNTITINGKEIEVSESASVSVDVGRYRNAYKPRGTFEGREVGQALILYSGINIGHGFKKRLRIDGRTVAVERSQDTRGPAPSRKRAPLRMVADPEPRIAGSHEQ